MSRVASARRLNLAQALVDARPPGLEDRPALRGPWGEWSYGRLEGHVAAAAGWLRERGVRRGQTVALCLPDGPAWVAAFLGAVRLGAVCALLSPDQPGEHLAGLLEPLGARLLIAGFGSDRRMLEYLWRAIAAADLPDARLIGAGRPILGRFLSDPPPGYEDAAQAAVGSVRFAGRLTHGDADFGA